MKNAFGMEIFEIRDLFGNPAVVTNIENTLGIVLTHLGFDDTKTTEIIKRIIEEAQQYEKVEDYEKTIHDLLESEGIVSIIPEKLTGRANKIYSQIRDYIEGQRVCDVGCGDGKVGEKVAEEGLEVILTDIYKHPHIDSLSLPFYEFKQGERIPLNDDECDTSLVLTVYHHSDDPIQVLQDVKRITKPGGRVLVIESVYGVTLEDKQPETHENGFLALTPEQQRLSNMFFDHFYNRVVHYNDDPAKKVNVPFNFNTPQGWKELFESYGMKQEEVVFLGVDMKTVPEYHTLHVLRVENKE